MAKAGTRRRAIKEVIAWGIRTNEMTPAEYLAGKGKEYRNMPQLRVYGREGQLSGGDRADGHIRAQQLLLSGLSKGEDMIKVIFSLTWSRLEVV